MSPPSLLEQRFPDLRLPRLSLGAFPVPVERLDGLPGEVWCKREDLSAKVYGGNKVRKLELVLAEAMQRLPPGGVLVTGGVAGSHHVLATAIFAKEAGLRVHAVVGPQSESRHARDNLRLSHALCERLTAVGRLADLPQAALALLRQLREPAVLVPIGGSSPRGTLGAVELGLEIGADVEAGRMPVPQRIYLPLGSGGTAAGLWLGLRLTGLESEVVAVRVAPRLLANAQRVAGLAREAARLLPGSGLRVGRALPGLRIVQGFAAPGYGRPSEAASRAMERAAELGLVLERTYSARSFAALMAEREAPGVALFVNTANGRSVEGLLEGVPEELPRALERLLVPG